VPIPRDAGWLRATLTLAVLGAFGGVGPAAPPGTPPPAPKTVRLYVFDCGLLNITSEGVQRYHVTPAEVGETRMSVPCFLIAHPKGTLMWDLGVIPDDSIGGSGQPARASVNATAAAVVSRTLRSQLAQIGYRPADITHVAFSHPHIDHCANANDYAAATWLVTKSDREFMWAENNTRVNPSFYTALKSSRSIVLDKDEHDVFGDGRVVIKAAPGHTPGHQVLVLNLAATGRVMLSGDLYHYPAERTLRRAPPDNEANVQQSAASRSTIEAYLQRTRTTLWIEHDFVSNAALRKSPAFYE
jgi:glyoxylase-like metal-dependent hydrolase (beta-lactamase superfamily II)